MGVLEWREGEREGGGGFACFYLTDTQSYLSPPYKPSHGSAACQFLTHAPRVRCGGSTCGARAAPA